MTVTVRLAFAGASAWPQAQDVPQQGQPAAATAFFLAQHGQSLASAQQQPLSAWAQQPSEREQLLVCVSVFGQQAQPLALFAQQPLSQHDAALVSAFGQHEPVPVLQPTEAPAFGAFWQQPFLTPME
jgi:hypothetical protein